MQLIEVNMSCMFYICLHAYVPREYYYNSIISHPTNIKTMALTDYEYVGDSHQSWVMGLSFTFILGLLVAFFLVYKNHQ
jgi:hypothetical protein